MSDSLMLAKAKAFAIRIVKLHKFLRGKREATMSKQVLRCGTSIGANLAEAKFAQSKEDFISKQTDLRRAIGVSTATVARLSKSEPVTLDFLLKICEALNCNLGDVVDAINDDAIPTDKK